MPRVLLLLPTTTYRTKAFVEEALKMHVDVVAASEQPSTLADKNPEGLLTLDFDEPGRAARQVEEFAAQFPIDAVIPVDEDTAVVAASVAQALKLRHNPVEAAITAKNKHRMREVLSRAGVQVPRYWHFSLDEDTGEVAARVTYPCVVKPVFLSTSRGVMRADNEEEFAGVVRRLDRIVSDPKVARRGGALAREALVEEFIPGFEVAVEGLVTDGEFRMLAIFDKPDPLDGPFFEETIYVTPSRLGRDVQRRIVETTAAATLAMGLTKGPVHAELRVNERGPWVIEVAARAIGGLCSRALRFDSGVSFEELIIRHALGEDVRSVEREHQAAGVMMIPIPRAGILREVLGVDAAKAMLDVEDVVITAHITQEILPPPEGASYLGFIFSRADTPDQVEAALREAHARLEFLIE
ncbi:MAG TPA: ATP-grasp domain-containing protein [Pyrinomonadaceae bacterium]|nr:ATP-grasp domain-containing protein [Pyrinomonadaceae bacterium]